MDRELQPSRRVPQRRTDLETNTFPFAVSPQRCKFPGCHMDCLNGKTYKENSILQVILDSYPSHTPESLISYQCNIPVKITSH